jgi:hypothetical protein
MDFREYYGYSNRTEPPVLLAKLDKFKFNYIVSRSHRFYMISVYKRPELNSFKISNPLKFSELRRVIRYRGATSVTNLSIYKSILELSLINENEFKSSELKSILNMSIHQNNYNLESKINSDDNLRIISKFKKGRFQYYSLDLRKLSELVKDDSSK